MPSKDLWSKQVDELGGARRPFDPKAHRDVTVQRVGGAFRLSCEIFDIDFAGQPTFDSVLDARGREMLSATLEKQNGAAVGISWFSIPPNARFNLATALSEVRAGMQEAHEKILSERPVKLAGEEAHTFVTIIDAGRPIHVDTTVMALERRHAVIQLMVGYPVGNIEERSAGERFAGSLVIH